MTDCTVGAPVRATKAQARAKEVPATEAKHQPAEATNNSERIIAANVASLLGQAQALLMDEDGPAHCLSLIEFGQKILHQVRDDQLEFCIAQDAFLFASGACAGALAIDQRDHPEAGHRHQLIDAAFQVLNNASLGYDCNLDSNDVAAAAIMASAMLPDSRATVPQATPPADAIQAAFGQVEYLLNHAQATQEGHSWIGDSDCLIRMAHSLADAASVRLPTGGDVDQVACDIATLIRAARLVPGDSESNERKALLVQVEKHLRSITEDCIEDCCNPMVPRPLSPVATAEAVAQAADFRECARNACYEIQTLARAMQALPQDISDADVHPVTHGIMARIIVLTEIVHHAACLHGGPPMVTLSELKNSYKGRF